MKRYRYNEEKGILESIETNDIKIGDLILLYYRYQRESLEWRVMKAITSRKDTNGDNVIGYKDI